MSQILILGESWGQEEARRKEPFVGAAGYHLTQMLKEAGINRADCYLTNVFNLHPPKNDLKHFSGTKAEAIDGYPQLGKGLWIHKRLQPELDRLAAEITAESPNLILALGNTAMWATLGKTAISKFRGTTAISTCTASGFKVLPTYHPAAVLRQWELRPIVVADLGKARRESLYPDIRRPKVTIYVPETPAEIWQFHQEFILEARSLAVDIETAGNQITCIGMSPNRDCVLVIPIHDYRRKNRSYWQTREDEQEVWAYIRSILTDPRPGKVFQNGLYDISFLWRSYAIAVRGAEHDTMLMHHALQPEMLKGLAFLGSCYGRDHGAWKADRRYTGTIKRDE